MIYNETLDDDYQNVTRFSRFDRKYIIKICFILVFAFLTSSIEISSQIHPLAYAILGVAAVFNAPLLLVAIVSSISMLVFGIGTNEITQYIITFIVFSIITSLLNINGIGKKYIVLIKLFISMVIINTISCLFLDASVVSSMLTVIISIIGYLVFVYGTSVILNINKGYIFTEEEKISAICMVAFLISSFGNISISGVHISNVLIIMLVFIYGYKRGALLGCTAGAIASLISCIITGTNAIFVAVLACSGLISGITNKLSKKISAICFVLACVIISYLAGNFSYYIPNIVEVLLAIFPILFIPSSLVEKIENLFNLNNALEKPYDNLLEASTFEEKKLSIVSDIMSDIAETEIEYSKEDKIEFRDVLKKYILEYIKEMMLGNYEKSNSVDREKIELTVDYISSKLEENEEINEDMIMFECENKTKLIENIKDIYNSIKIMRILKKKEEDIHKTASNQYKEISNIISSISKNSKPLVTNHKDVKSIREELKLLGYPVYEDELVIDNDYIEYTFITDILADTNRQKKEITNAVSNILGKNMTVRLLLNISKTEKSKIKLASVTQYFVETDISQKSKNELDKNGDSHLAMNFGSNKYISVLSDGAGSGEIAKKSSETVINTLEKLINAGFDETKASEIVNRIIKLREDDTSFASLDATIFDLEEANANFIKIGAAPTYIVSDDKVTTISSMNLPMGLVSDIEYVPIIKKLNNGEIVVQISDGVIAGENNIHDNYFTELLKNINFKDSSKSIADKLMEEVVNHNEKSYDDVTIAISKVMATKSIK